jgi:hypothetical protein
MELWTEYEGRTIDGVFPLAKLLQPEGRSAFFSTPTGTGAPTVIRLIESHFDDEEILGRWRGVEALHHPNLIELQKFGQVELDGTPLVYAVMEPAEANLGEIIAERRLTVDETREIATSLAAALDALHTNGFIHEHVEPGNVFAVGEGIKLRSDCIRETPEGTDGQKLKQRDVHDLAVVLLRAMTQQRTLEDAARDLPLPAPFDAIVPNAMSGAWGLPQIAAALKSDVILPQPLSIPPSGDVVVASSPVPRPAPQRVELEDESSGSGMWTGLKLILGLSVLVLVVIAWHMFHHPSPESTAALATPAPAATVPSATVPAATAPQPVPAVPKPSPEVGTAAAVVPSQTAAAVRGGRTQWRVIAFTYNHEDQAKGKVAQIAVKHPDLQPEVFRPNDHAPYLVTIGGVMSREDAFALANKARDEGVAHDVYAQNYRPLPVSADK